MRREVMPEYACDRVATKNEVLFARVVLCTALFNLGVLWGVSMVLPMFTPANMWWFLVPAVLSVFGMGVRRPFIDTWNGLLLTRSYLFFIGVWSVFPLALAVVFVFTTANHALIFAPNQ